MQLLPTRDPRWRAPVGRRHVVVAHRPANRAPLARAAALARDRGSTLHVVVAAGRPPSPWALLAGRLVWNPGLGTTVEVDQLIARGIHVEVHHTIGHTGRLAAAIASTVGGDLVA